VATNLLNNCSFDLTKIKKLYLGISLSTGGTINFPLDYNTNEFSLDSIIQYNNWTLTNVITIGSQNIQFHEIQCVGNNITFDENIIIDQRGRNYVKTLTFELSGINQNLVDELELFTLSAAGYFIPIPILAILIDENDQYLLVGYDFPLRLETIVDNIDNENNNMVITYKSQSVSRTRIIGLPTPSITPTISTTPSRTPSITPTSSPSRTPSITPTISMSQSPAPIRESYIVQKWACNEFGVPVPIGGFENINMIIFPLFNYYYAIISEPPNYYLLVSNTSYNPSYPVPDLIGPFATIICPP